MVRRLAFAVLLFTLPGAVSAADLVVSRRAVVTATVAPGLWRGHFSGGRNFDPRNPEIVAVDWTDQVAFFPSDASCRRWIGDLRHRWKTYQGFTGCLRIR